MKVVKKWTESRPTPTLVEQINEDIMNIHRSAWAVSHIELTAFELDQLSKTCNGGLEYNVAPQKYLGYPIVVEK
jgi:hypothetical protein